MTSKTPEELANDWIEKYLGGDRSFDDEIVVETSFLAGYQAAKETEPNNWVALKDEMPPKGIWLLFRYPWGSEVNKLKWVGDDGLLDFHRYYYDQEDPSHWMPLPQPPKEEA